MGGRRAWKKLRARPAISNPYPSLVKCVRRNLCEACDAESGEVSVPEVRLRVASGADLAEVVALERRVVEAPHWAEAEYAVIVGSGGEGAVRRCLFVAETDEKLLGFAVGKVILSVADRVGELESVAVDAAGRRRGVGRSLCEAVIGWCRDHAAVEMELEVRAGSGGAIALYAGLGFGVVGRRRGYYQEPDEDAVLMQLKLAETE